MCITVIMNNNEEEEGKQGKKESERSGSLVITSFMVQAPSPAPSP
jgi:hypothetical protein